MRWVPWVPIAVAIAIGLALFSVPIPRHRCHPDALLSAARPGTGGDRTVTNYPPIRRCK